jgi:penicillin-insensitive murein endopeptidase
MAALAGAPACLACLASLGCARSPSPLTPQWHGSIGMPHRGVLTDGADLPRRGEGYRWLRDDDRHHGLPRFVATIERAAATVARERPGATLGVGDLSARTGGQLMPHLSHRSGRDADLLLYLTTLEGAPVESPGFIHVEADGLAWDEKGARFYRFDVERQWLLVKALLEDDEGRIQWIFCGRNVAALLLEWARARGERGELVWRAQQVLLQPQPGGPHDDHVHVRTACNAAELAAGCEWSGPMRPWLELGARSPAPPPETNAELVAEILRALPGDRAGDRPGDPRDDRHDGTAIARAAP